MAWRDREFPQQSTLYAAGLIWGFAELRLDQDTFEVTLLSTPNSGNGEPILEHAQTFERRSGIDQEPSRSQPR
jgi:hypothetical protein